jgi:HD-GYP domain-containing protein (c-di-GMP phosphodiesterase class II)
MEARVELMTNESSLSREELLAAQAELRQEIADLKERVASDKHPQPIAGMMKLLKAKNQQIEESIQQLQESNRQLLASYEQTLKYYKNTITAMASAMEARDPFFQFHSSQVEALSRKIAKALNLDKQATEQLSTTAYLHDFGNIGIRWEVIHKPGPLTPEETQHVRTHPMVASLILEPIGDLGPVIAGIKHHHEHYDGTGYPEGLSGDAIPLFARIIIVAESYDAISSPRPYRTPLRRDQAVAEIAAHIGTRYDPGIIKAFLQVQK